MSYSFTFGRERSRMIFCWPSRNSCMIRLPCSRCSKFFLSKTMIQSSAHTFQTILQATVCHTDIVHFPTRTGQGIDDVPRMTTLHHSTMTMTMSIENLPLNSSGWLRIRSRTCVCELDWTRQPIFSLGIFYCIVDSTTHSYDTTLARSAPLVLAHRRGLHSSFAVERTEMNMFSCRTCSHRTVSRIPRPEDILFLRSIGFHVVVDWRPALDRMSTFSGTYSRRV